MINVNRVGTTTRVAPLVNVPTLDPIQKFATPKTANVLVWVTLAVVNVSNAHLGILNTPCARLAIVTPLGPGGCPVTTQGIATVTQILWALNAINAHPNGTTTLGVRSAIVTPME